ncbi:hypothetical protein E4U31_006164 [Claviceps sp. LM219 group G6]|nr:hypothetical protein E4U31_006164 [Claviceps sp. LM219 group G6]
MAPQDPSFRVTQVARVEIETSPTPFRPDGPITELAVSLHQIDIHATDFSRRQVRYTLAPSSDVHRAKLQCTSEDRKVFGT